MTMEGNTSPVNKISLNFNCMDLASSVNNFQGDMGARFKLLETSEKSSNTWSGYEKTRRHMIHFRENLSNIALV